MGKYDALFEQPSGSGGKYSALTDGQTPPEVPLLERVFPVTTSALKSDNLAAHEMAPLAALGDVASLEQRVFGKLMTGTDLGDPQGGYLKGVRESSNAVIDARIKAVKASKLPDVIKHLAIRGLQAEGLGAEFTANALEAPITTFGTAGLSALAKTGPISEMLQKGALRFGSLAHAEDAVAKAGTRAGLEELKAGAKETPDLLAREVKGAVEGVDAARQAALDKGVAGSLPGAKEPFARGQSLYDALQEGRQAVGAKFQAQQDKSLVKSGVASSEIPVRPKGGVGSEATGLFGPNGEIIARPKVKMQNAAQDQVDNILKEIQYDPSKGEYGVIGNRVVGKDAISVLKRYHDELSTAKTTQDVLNLRRLIDNEINFGGKEGRRMFVKGSDDDFVMTQLRDRLNDVVEAQFARHIKDPQAAAVAAQAWREKNKFYSDVVGSMGDVSKSLPDQKQNYIAALEKMDVGKLKKVMQAAQENPKELGQVADEIRGGFVDGFLNRSLKDGHIDFKQAKKAWDGIDPELRRVMFSQRQRDQIDFAIKKFAESEGEGVAGKKLGSYLSENEKTISDKLSNVANPDKRYVLKELEFLDALQGRTGKDAFAFRAKNMSQAKQLGMDEAGKIPMISGEKNGKFLAGSGIGGATGASIGAAVGNAPGAAVGSIVGTGAGMVAQSPWGTVQLYRIFKDLGKLSEASKGPAKTAAKLTAGKAAAATAAHGRSDEQ